MADFNKAWEIQSQIEGGFNKNLGDGAGMTYRGITEKWQPEWTGWNFIREKLKSGIKIREEFIFKELEDSVKLYYISNKWNLIKGDLLTYQDIANILFSFVVMSGQARKVINQTINIYAKKVIVIEDNKFSNTALDFLNKNPNIYSLLFEQRMKYMQSLSLWDKFKNSWTRAMNFFKKTTPIDTFLTKPYIPLFIISTLSILGFFFLKPSKKRK